MEWVSGLLIEEVSESVVPWVSKETVEEVQGVQWVTGSLGHWVSESVVEWFNRSVAH